ncbi:MAG: hypothetical protein A3E87_05170 [Gammaproteobacteria bacterium RIFCSPHIGHO2_12_FULL_35_23]|nr:MAG: hypothetical protein A3E87_05170 [Gammaproteobacteria bacterium RIFCSPHIGHO2_12_FULL_35_23]
MSHLGLLHATAFAEKGFGVICYDNDRQVINNLQQGILPITEPQLDELFNISFNKMRFSTALEPLKQCNVIFIACDVPTDNSGNSDLTIIHQLVNQVLSVISDNCCLILLSQVPPGFTRAINFAKQKLFYQVETLIFGQAVERALYPERFIIGVNDPTQSLPKDYLNLLSSFNCPILTMRYESAELAKIAINMFLVSSVSTTNLLADICEKINADWQEIMPALKLDKRIGPYAYLNPGLGIAGGNLERDLNTVIQLGQTHHSNTNIVQAWLEHSKYRQEWVWQCLQQTAINKQVNPTICILGLTYKANTHSIKNSPAINLINRLKNYRIKVHDPVVTIKDTHAEQKTDMISAIRDADIVIIMTPWQEYQHLTIDLLGATMKGEIVIDPYQVISSNDKQITKIKYFTLGKQSKKTDREKINYVET